MGTCTRGASVISWAQTFIEGVPAEPQQELVEGMSWSWQGALRSLEGDPSSLLLTTSRDQDELRARAARVVRKILQHPAPCPADFADRYSLEDELETDPIYRGAFVVSDGIGFFSVVPVVLEDGTRPVLLFHDGVPPCGQDLTIVHCAKDAARPVPSSDPRVICFTPGTKLRTASGDVAIEDIGPGDRVLTRDSGLQEVLWTGQRRMSGARLFAMPDQRPIRLRRGALGVDRPEDDLLVSPDHRVLVSGAAARDIWGEGEVLVRAADLVGDRCVTVDHSMRETFYIHLMLGSHEVVWANGLAVETFHPGYSGLGHLSELERSALFALRPELAECPHNYGAPTRRMLSRAEAAIMMSGAAQRPRAAFAMSGDEFRAMH